MVVEVVFCKRPGWRNPAFPQSAGTRLALAGLALDLVVNQVEC
jgi:hypothetical protein